MSGEQFITIKENVLNNHCPECFSNNGLHLLFKQKFIDTKFYKSITNDTMFEINCKTCNTAIYPARWTDDIERVVAYHEKAFTPKKPSLKLKRLSWILIIFGLVVIIAGTTVIVFL